MADHKDKKVNWVFEKGEPGLLILFSCYAFAPIHFLYILILRQVIVGVTAIMTVIDIVSVSYVSKTLVMKKTFFILVILIPALIACKKNPLKPDASQAVASSFHPNDTISRTTALDMVTHYLDSTVDHSLDSIIKQVSLYNSDLFEIFKLSTKEKPITRIRLLAAAYLDTDSIVARRNHKTVLVQLKFNYNSSYSYYDIQTFGADRLCPPPMGCSTE